MTLGARFQNSFFRFLIHVRAPRLRFGSFILTRRDASPYEGPEPWKARFRSFTRLASWISDMKNDAFLTEIAMRWSAVARHGLILRQNGDLRLNILFPAFPALFAGFVGNQRKPLEITKIAIFPYFPY